jgi:small-conductance mechanosensitive channel
MKQLRVVSVAGFLSIVVALLVCGGLAFAQGTQTGETSVAVPDALGPEAMGELASKLNPEQTEALAQFMELLSTSVAERAPDAAAAEKAPIMDTIEASIATFGNTMAAHLTGLPEAATDILAGTGAIFAGRGFGGGVWFLGLLILIVAVGFGAEWIVNWVTASRRDTIKDTRPQTLLETLKVLSARALIQIGGLIAFTVAALVAARVFLSSDTDRLIASLVILQPILIPRLAAAVLRFVLAPQRQDLRLVSTDDETARFIYRHLVILAAVVGVSLFMLAAAELSGYVAGAGTFRFWVGLMVTLWIIHVSWRARTGLTAIIKGDEEQLTPGLERMATWWPAFSIVIIGLQWLSIQFSLSTGDNSITPGRGVLTLALIVMAPFLDTMVRGIAAHLVPAMEGEGAVAEKAYQDTRLSYVRIGRVVLFAALVIAIGKIMGIDFAALTEAGLGARIAAGGLSFLLILALGYLAWEVTNLWVNRQLAREMPETGGDGEGGEVGGAGQSRMATILPILRMTLQATIITITVLLALSQLGVNITPLLAGAGVLGLAIGFGAQTLVKDIVSGVFFLLDDAFRIGEYIDVGGTEGSVERILVRSLQLRGALGAVHVVPYGSISKLTNMSRDWVITKLKFTVPFDTDLEKVRKIFKKIGQQIEANPEYADDLLAPFKSQGAADVTDVGIVVRGKFTTKPGGQWGIRKEIYNRVQKAFEENGIAFARREVRVQVTNDEDGGMTADRKSAIAAAAAQASEPAR